ncbi:toll/interleukin-1 receptor domain-containing protein [Flavobacterium sp. MAHUQ-51]|uniref:toll/interleukin-1 receptor domain-containing protein n=1 Tax=Flavobacterium sp. GCM10022190 TaxID=3252639 RepID=UPI003622FE92
MRTLREYFDNDFKHSSLDSEFSVIINDTQNGIITNSKTITITKRVRDDVLDSCRLLTYYMEDDENMFDVLVAILNNLDEQISNCEIVHSISNDPKDLNFGKHKNIYSNRIYFYSEPILSEEEKNTIDVICNEKKIYLTIRGKEYMDSRLKVEKPLSFISHDSRDKELIARPIADGLNSRLCTVWYDEYTLKPGMSLRESIEDGLKNTKKCILILTKNFLENTGWTKKEFNSVFTREMIFNEKVIIPIWFGIKTEEVYEYSPSLADTLALIWPDKNVMTENEYKTSVEKLISKLHIAITE